MLTQEGVTIFVYCSLNPIRRLFVSRIKCSQEYGRFFVKSFTPGRQQDRLVTFYDDGYRKPRVSTYDCDDKYGDFIPVESFKLKEIGIPDGDIDYATVSGKFAFVLTSQNIVYMFNPCHKFLYFKFQLHQENPGPCFNRTINIDFNGQEVFVSRKSWSRQKMDIFKVKKQTISLYNICCRYLTQSFSERKIKRLPLPHVMVRDLLLNIF